MTKGMRTAVFCALTALYITGICIGGIGQTHTAEQKEMFEYLSAAVNGYCAKPLSVIKSIAAENAVYFAVLAAAGTVKPLSVLCAAVMPIKGYAAGFSVTAMLRLYGIKGLAACIPNLLSAAFVIPAMAFYGTASVQNLKNNKGERIFYKYYFILLIFLATVFCADSAARGFLLTIFMKLASGFAAEV